MSKAIKDPKMFLLLKPQTSILSGRTGPILQQILAYFSANQQDDIPLISDSQGFTFSGPINEYIRSGTKCVLMLVDAKTRRPCATLWFSYNDDDNNVYIDYFDGDKGVVVCGGGATYLLDHFCSALDTITELGHYIKLTLHDVAKNSSVYDAYFSDRDAYKGRCRYSSGIGDTTTERNRQKNGSYDDEDNCVLTKTVETNRGTGVAPNLRKYTIVSWIPPRVYLPRGAKFGKCDYSRHAPHIETRKSRSRSRDSSRSIDTRNYPLSDLQIKKILETQTIKQGTEHIISTILFLDENDKQLNAELNKLLIYEEGCNYRDSVKFLIENFDEVKHKAILTKLKCRCRNELENFLSLYNEEMADRAANANAKGITKRKTKKMKMKMTMKKGYRVRR